MARVQSYSRVVDPVLINTNPALNTEIQSGVKIKEEPKDTTSDSDTIEDILNKNCFSLIDHDYHYRDESSFKSISCKDINSTESKHLSNSHHTHSNDVNEIINVERKVTKTKKEIDNTLQFKKQKCFNKTSNNKNVNILRSTKDTIKKRRKLRHKSKLVKKKSVDANKCDICFRKFSSFKNCIVHKQHYAFEKDNNCRFCRQHYVTQEELQSHKCPREHRVRIKTFRYHCNFCSRTFKEKGLLQSHLFHIHSELIFFNNTVKHSTSRSENVNTSSQDDTLRTNINDELLCFNNLVKSEKIDTVINNVNKSCDNNMIDTEKSTINESSDEMSLTGKRLRQPTLTEYIELCKKKRDIKISPNKLNITKDEFSTCASHHDKQTRGNLRPKECNEQIDFSPAKLDNYSKQKAHSTLEQNAQPEKCKKPFVKLYADVEIMKSFLENLPDTAKDKGTEDQVSDVSYDRGVPYSLRSLNGVSYVEADSNSRMRKSKNIPKKSRFNIESNIKKEQNIDLSKIDSKLKARFKCKKCTISLTRCDERLKNSYQISTTDVGNNSLTIEGNLTLDQKSDQKSEVRNTMILKDLEVSLERLAPVVPDIKATVMKTDIKESDLEKYNYNYFLCKICEKSFTSKLAKRLHIKSTHVAYMSSICDARYTGRHKLLQHYLREHQFEQNQCCICYTLLSDYEELKQHLYVHCLKYIQRKDDQYQVNVELNCSLIKNAYKCFQCDKTFSSQSSLLAHQSCCAIKEEKQEDFMEQTSSYSKESLEVQQKNTDENIVTCNEEINSNTPCEPLNNDYLKKLNEHKVSLCENESRTNKAKQILVKNNLLNEEKLETVNESQNSTKLLENNNSTVNNQNITNTQLDDVTGKNVTYPCDICGKQFQNSKNLEIHVRTFSFTTDICPMCGTGFSSKRLLQTHITAAHVPQISKTYSFHCVFCNQGFLKKHDLRPHILHLHGQQMLNTLTRNLNNQEKSDETVTTHTAMCNICNLVFETHDRYVEHRMYYYKNHTFKCKLCEQNFQGMYMFHHHNKLIHYSEDKRKLYSYICDICNEGFNHESHFYSHNMHVHSNEVNLAETAKEFEDRNRSDYSSQNAQEQIKNVIMNHKQKKQPSNECICQICQLKCTDMNHMAKHVEFYANDGDFKCDKCERRCRTFPLLDQHRKLTHHCRDVYNGHLCHICGEVLETLIALKCHEKHSHSNTTNNTDNRKNCNQKSSSNITRKIAEHSYESKNINNIANVTEYNCVFCDMKFSTASSVQTHIVHVHMDDMLNKRATLRLALPITNSYDIQKQFAETDQTPSSSSISSSEDKSIQFLQKSAIQQSNIVTNIMPKTGINDGTTIKLKKLKTLKKITEKTPISSISCINKSNQDNISSCNTIASNTKSRTNTSVSLSIGQKSLKLVVSNNEIRNNSSAPLSTGSTIFKTVVSNAVSNDNTESKTDTSCSSSIGSTSSRNVASSETEFRNNNSLSLSTGSTTFKTFVSNTESKANASTSPSKSANDLRKSYEVPSKVKSINEYKANSVSSLNRSVIVENKSKTTSVCPLSTISLSTFKHVMPQSWQSNRITNQKSESENNYNYSYSCPLCPLEYPSLMFFHAHLKYAHADSIRTQKLNIPQMNQAQKASIIECLLCPCIFLDEISYKKHLRNSHMYFVYISNSETQEVAKINNSSNPPVTQTSINKEVTIPEVITVDDDDNHHHDNIKNTADQQTTKVTAMLDHREQNEKIGKLRVKPFARIMENLPKDSASEVL
ncbi:uncharacterized protein LOC105840213 [Monomorium pharaonis]|uniref:uncharacterized protein LOC105840213 n=1 Tax=Monomorium pharaonis TaxID=307658 RepID=UPI0017462A5C|nr:uncharacterized protein LOC105840213 [Monomorium pharaonis]XP_036143646.1 uncharacterized protein LOC105840213 [Monomorium pharaonis]